MITKLIFLAVKFSFFAYPVVLAIMEQVSDLSIVDEYWHIATGGSIAGGGGATFVEIYHKIPKRFAAIDSRQASNEEQTEKNKEAITKNSLEDAKTQGVLEQLNKTTERLDGLVNDLLKK